MHIKKFMAEQIQLPCKPMNNITVFEFDEISVGNGEKQLSKSDFEELKQFILPKRAEEEQTANNEVDEETLTLVRDASACMSLGSKNGNEVIRVKNYVGIVSLKSGTTIEILPKTAYNPKSDETEFARRFVVEMLYASGNISYKSFQRANLEAHRNMNLYEVFIRLFLDELNELYKKGLKAGYVFYEDNENFLKGKVLFNEHIKRNFAHKEKFYVGYETFSFDRVENRLIKSTLIYLKNKSHEDQNRRDIRRMLLIFDEITPSQNYDSDFQRCDKGRTGREYADVLALCKVFLVRKNFTMYGGKNEATALLFPMNILFEKYIAKEMAGAVAKLGWSLFDQDTGKYLFENKKFPLRPDIVLRSKTDERVFIIDTKWKRLYNNPRENYGISQADMYQMYAYHTRYENVQTVILLYPLYEPIMPAPQNYETQVKDIQVKIQIRLFDLRGYIEGGKEFWDCLDKKIGELSNDRNEKTRVVENP